MTLDEAIRHCCSKASSDTECGREHAQLAEWLAELKELQAENSELVVEHSDALNEIDRLVDENTKLRERCNELMKQKDCGWCYDRGSECTIIDRLCELGIEVPE